MGDPCHPADSSLLWQVVPFDLISCGTEISQCIYICWKQQSLYTGSSSILPWVFITECSLVTLTAMSYGYWQTWMFLFKFKFPKPYYTETKERYSWCPRYTYLPTSRQGIEISQSASHNPTLRDTQLYCSIQLCPYCQFYLEPQPSSWQTPLPPLSNSTYVEPYYLVQPSSFWSPWLDSSAGDEPLESCGG